MLTIKQMHQHILFAYLRGKTKNKISIDFSNGANDELDINVWEHSTERATKIDIYGFYSDKEKQNNFEKIIALLTGEISLFDETPTQREIRATEEIF